MRWPHVGQANRRKSKYSWARALTSSGTTRPPVGASRLVFGRSYAGGRAAVRGRRPDYPFRMARTRIPEAVLTAAHERSAARAARNWPEADRLRGEIEAAGWKVVDRGTDFALEPVHAATVEAAGVV